MTAVADRGLSDAAIIEASWRDKNRFGQLYDRYAPMLYRYAHRRLGPSACVEDVVADAFVVAFRKRRDYDLARPDARPWLFGIATREIARYRRAEEARYRALSRAPVEEVMDGFADRVAAMVAAQAMRGPLTGALGRLRPAHRDVLLLVAWGDLSYEEVAESLNIKIGTVRSRLHRARQQVRAALALHDPSEVSRRTP
jgi:RNA polymerase sigma factor (sigma-70 family)